MVEFKLTKEQLLAKELFRSFAENEIKPISRDMDEAEKFDMDLLDKMKKYGLMGIPYSKAVSYTHLTLPTKRIV